MEDRNSPEAMAARASQADPIVVYLIIRESLEMSPGKIAAQCAHASQMLTLKYVYLKYKAPNTFGIVHTTDPKTGILVEDAEAMRSIHIFEEWLDKSFRKVVLRADDHRFERLRAENPNHVVVVDAGLTEVAPGSETVLALWPMYRSTCSKYLAKTQVLK